MIITDTPTGHFGKADVITQIQDAFGVEGKSIFVCDDSADVGEEVACWAPQENPTTVHIKLGRKRRAEEDCITAKFFCVQRLHQLSYRPVKGKIASDGSRSDGLEPLSGRVVSETQAVSSPVQALMS